MERLSDTAIAIINELHKERLDYQSEYLPLIDAANKLADYENTGLEPEDMYAVRLLAASAEGRLLVMPRKVDDILDLLRQMAISAVYEAALKSGHGKEMFIAAKDGINRRFENFNQTRFEAEAALKGGSHETT